MPFSATASVTVSAPLAKVWEGITVPSEVKKYFFGTDLVTTWEPGTPVLFKGEWQGKAYEDKGTVLAFEPQKRLKFDYFSAMSGKEDKPENYQVIAYDLAETPSGVTVTITQDNAPTQEAADHSAGNWKTVLEGMKKLVEAA
jgi:uncharacterized protein YndB with AHSA1/START domain